MNPAPTIPFLDRLLTSEEASEWLGLHPRALRAKSLGKNAPIPAFELSCRSLRYHPRTILASMAARAGVDSKTIAAAFQTPHETSKTA